MNSLLRKQALCHVRKFPISNAFVGRLNVARSLKTNSKMNDVPKLRYFFFTFLASSVVLYFAGRKVEKKKPKTSFESEREYLEYEEKTGLKRRSKLISPEKNEQYKFYALPTTSETTVDQIVKKIKEENDSTQIKIIDPNELIEQEKADETRKYCYLLHDIANEGRSIPKGLITALVKQEIKFFINTRSGTFDTNFILKNYPQSTDEAIRFENDVSEIKKCYVVDPSVTSKNYDVRDINNVIGYFETVDKTELL